MDIQYLFKTLNIQPEEKLYSFELEGDRRETELVIVLFCSLASEMKGNKE